MNTKLRPYDQKEAMQREKEQPGSACVTREGTPLRILCFDFKGDYQILVAIKLEDGKERLSGRYASGKDPHESCNDLFMAPVTVTIWVNVYRNHDGSECYHSVTNEIDRNPNYIATVPISWEERNHERIYIWRP